MGGIATQTDLKLLANTLDILMKRVSVEISRSKTEEEVAANTEITKEFDEKGYGDGFINGEKIRRTIYQQLTNPYKNEEERMKDLKMKQRQRADENRKN